MEGSERGKKKILLLSCKGGYEHVAASRALQKITSGLYECKEVFPIEEVQHAGEHFYNALLQHNWIRITNFLSSKLAPLFILAKQEALEECVHRYIVSYQPDIVVSFVPFINYAASLAAQKSGIPYLLITTDNDLSNWVLGLDKITHPEWQITIGQDHALTRGLLIEKGVARDRIHFTGLPIDPLFFAKRSAQVIRDQYEIPLDKPVLTMLLGGTGGKGISSIVKELFVIDIPLHVALFCGEGLYGKVREIIDKKEGRSEVSFSLIRSMGAVADLMQVSDVLMTKPGSGPIQEAMVRQLPILIDHTQPILSWERTNVDFVRRLGVGQVITKAEDLRRWIPLYVQDVDVRAEVQQVYANRGGPCFADNIVQLLAQMLYAKVGV